MNNTLTAKNENIQSLIIGAAQNYHIALAIGILGTRAAEMQYDALLGIGVEPEQAKGLLLLILDEANRLPPIPAHMIAYVQRGIAQKVGA